MAERVIDQRDLAEVLVDTTVMEKAVTYPTDGKLHLKSRLRLNRRAKAHGIALRQSCTRTAKALAIKASRYAHARQYRWMRKALKQLKGRLGRVVRDIERKTVDWPTLPDSLVHELTFAKRLLAQKSKGSNKLYSLLLYPVLFHVGFLTIFQSEAAGVSRIVCQIGIACSEKVRDRLDVIDVGQRVGCPPARRSR